MCPFADSRKGTTGRPKIAQSWRVTAVRDQVVSLDALLANVAW